MPPPYQARRKINIVFILERYLDMVRRGDNQGTPTTEWDSWVALYATDPLITRLVRDFHCDLESFENILREEARLAKKRLFVDQGQVSQF